MNELCHHGVKGQKWGVRRYQNKDGSLTAEGRKRRYGADTYRYINKTGDSVQKIVDTMSRKERHLLGGDPSKPYMSEDEIKYVAKRFIERYKNEPVAFLDIYYASNGAGTIAIGTRSDARGKGHANSLVKKAQDWLDSPQAKDILGMNTLNWFARNENEASIGLAKKSGFVERDDYKDDKEWWGGRYRR